MKIEKADKEKRYRNVEKKSREYEEEVKELRRQLKRSVVNDWKQTDKTISIG